MFKLKFANMYDNSIFQHYNLKPVAEDYYLVKDNIFCVADGVTRDTAAGDAVPYPQTEEQARAWVNSYPNPSGAYDAAKICANTFVGYMSDVTAPVTTDAVRDAVHLANNNIAQINRR